MEKLECQEAGAPKRRPCDLRVAESMARHVLEQAWLALYVQLGVSSLSGVANELSRKPGTRPRVN